MAKRGGFPGGMMGMPGNMNNLMKQAQKMQRQMEEQQKEILGMGLKDCLIITVTHRLTPDMHSRYDGILDLTQTGNGAVL